MLLLCLQDREGPHKSQIPRFVGAGAVTPPRSVLAVSKVQLVVFKVKPAELGWVGLQSQVPTTALHPLEIKMGLSLEHKSCSGAAEAPRRLLREL